MSAGVDLSDAGGADDAVGGPKTGLVGTLSSFWPTPGSELEIRGGGAVAVDTATLRAAAARYTGAGVELSFVLDRLGALSNMLLSVRDYAWAASSSTWTLCLRLREVREAADGIAAALREGAAMYELVELNVARRAAVLEGDAAAAARLARRLDDLRDRHPDAWPRALESEFERAVMWPADLQRQATQLGVEAGGLLSDPGAVIGGVAGGLVTLGTAAAVGVSGAGLVARDARLSGTAGPVTVTPVAPARASGAPQGLADVAERMPGAGDARVRVERYAMADGSQRFAVYIAGMRSQGVGGDEPWDNRSNVELYTGRVSDSYAATEQALAAAGARPGDAVHVFGHSQGAMIGSRLALEGDYDTRTLVTFGSPVEADVGPSTLSVVVRHSDDPVAALAGGGHMASVGAPGSIVVERVHDPAAGWHDVPVPSHGMADYAETAALIDSSGDARVDALRQAFTELDGAVSVEATEYAAARGVSPSTAGGG